MLLNSKGRLTNLIARDKRHPYHLQLGGGLVSPLFLVILLSSTSSPTTPLAHPHIVHSIVISNKPYLPHLQQTKLHGSSQL